MFFSISLFLILFVFFFFQAEDGIRDTSVTGVQTCALPISSDQAFKTAHDAYAREFLRRYPTVNTYLGGAGLDPALREVDGTLRDWSPAAIERSEERRVGKECRCRWSPDHDDKKEIGEMNGT